MPRKTPAKRASSTTLTAVPDPPGDTHTGPFAALAEGQGSVELDSTGEPTAHDLLDDNIDNVDQPPDHSSDPPTAEDDATELAAAITAAADNAGRLLPNADPLELQSLAEQDEFSNGLWWGEEGGRKTTDVCTMANGGTIVVVNAEAGLKNRALRRRGINTDNILVFPPNNQPLTFESLEGLYWKLKEMFDSDPHALYGVVWDSLTEIHKKLLDNVVLYQIDKADRAGRERERFFIDRSDFGVMTEQVRLLLRRFRDLPCHFAVTALSRRDQDDDGEVKYGPAVTPALQSDLVGFMDHVIHCRVELAGGEEVGLGLTGKGTKFAAKDRDDVLPRLMVDPTFERVRAYVVEELDYETDLVQAAEKQRRDALRLEAETDKTKREA